MGLHIPDLPPDVDNLTAALKYAEAGWYVLPVRMDTKHPGSVVGPGWPSLSSQDPKQIAAWFAASDHGIALHCGRSGAVVLDVDTYDNIPDEVLTAIETTTCPYQSTRPDQPGRGHYLFANTTGRRLGNGLGKLATTSKWGEVRGANGVIIAAPSIHPEGGHYQWQRTGDLPPIPDYVADALPNSTSPEDTATDAEVQAFLAEHIDGSRPEILRGLTSILKGEFETGSRHVGALSVTARAMEEARAGYYPAKTAVDTLEQMFVAAATRAPTGGEHQRTHDQAQAEYAGIVAWAVGQARAADLDAVRARVDEKMPVNVEWVDRIEDAILGAASDGELLHRNAVQAELCKLRVRDEARRLHDLEKRAEAAAAIPKGVTLTEFLAVPDEDAAYRIDEVLPKGGRALLSAQFKAGKSTLTSNLTRSLADATPFLGRFAVNEPAKVALLDDELDERQLRRWLRQQGVVNTDAVTIHSLRGRTSSFDILNADIRTEWADRLRGSDFVILDCLRPVLDALGLSEDKEAGRFLVAFDELLLEAAVSEAVVVQHMGHVGERSRGDSRLLDWPDVLWKIVRDNGEDDGPEADRYFSAYGRDVDVREGKLDYTPETRSLMYVDTNRKESAGRSALPDLVDVLNGAGDGLSGRQLESALTGRGHPQKAAREAVKLAVRDRLIYTTDGPRNAKLHHLNPSSASVRSSALPVRQRGVSECVSASIETHSHSLPDKQAPVRHNALRSDGPPCDLCTKPMLAEQSIRRGICESCRIASERGAART